MAYYKDGLVEAQPDFNVFANGIARVKGDLYNDTDATDPTFGYGQIPVVEPVDVHDLVDAGDYIEGTGEFDATLDRTINKGFTPTKSWNQLLSDIESCAIHQGSALPSWLEDIMAAGGIITDDDITIIGNNATDLVTYINQLGIDRFNVDPIFNKTEVTSEISTRTAEWDIEIKYAFDVTFASYDEARYFFNTRGRIDLEVSYTLPGSPSDLDIEWQTLFSYVPSPLLFEYEHLDANSTELGFYGLTENFKTIYFRQGGGAVYSGGYGAENVIWIAKEDTTGPNYVINFEFRCRSGFGDKVNGTITGTPFIVTPDGIFDIVAPTLAKVVGFDEGGDNVDAPVANIAVDPGASQTCDITVLGTPCTNTYQLTAVDDDSRYTYSWVMSNDVGFTPLSSTTDQIVTTSATDNAANNSALVTLTVRDANFPELTSLTSVSLNSTHQNNIIANEIERFTGAPVVNNTIVGSSGATVDYVWDITSVVTNSGDVDTYAWTITSGSGITISGASTGATVQATKTGVVEADHGSSPFTGTLTLVTTWANGTSDTETIDLTGNLTVNAGVAVSGATISRSLLRDTCTFVAPDTGCDITWELTASHTDGLGTVTYGWATSDATNYPLSATTGKSITVTTPETNGSLPEGTITLTATDDNAGQTAQDTETLNLTASAGAITDVTITATPLITSCTYDRSLAETTCSLATATDGTEFLAVASGGSGETNITYTWEFVEVNPDIGFETVGTATYTGNNPKVVSLAGSDQTYTVACTATDTGGSGDTMTATKTATHNHTDVTVDIILGATMLASNATCGIGSGGEECTATNTASVTVTQGNPLSYEWTLTGNAEYELQDPDLIQNNIGNPITTNGANVNVISTTNIVDISDYTVTCIARANDLESDPVTSGAFSHTRTELLIDSMIESSNTGPGQIIGSEPVIVSSVIDIEVTGVPTIYWTVSVDEGNITSINSVGINPTSTWNGSITHDQLTVGVETASSIEGDLPINVVASLTDSVNRPGSPATQTLPIAHVRERNTTINITNLNGKSYQSSEYVGGSPTNMLFTFLNTGSWEMGTSSNIASGDWTTYNSSVGEWGAGSGFISSDYEARATFTSSSTSGVYTNFTNNMSAWSNMGTDHSVSATLTQNSSTANTDTYTVRVDVRKAGSTTILTTASFDWELHAPRNTGVA